VPYRPKSPERPPPSPCTTQMPPHPEPASRKPGYRILILTAAAACLILPAPTSSQSFTTTTSSGLSATTSEHIALFSINALIGGVTAGIFRLAHGAPLEQAMTDGFLRGALGGGLSYAGKRVTASRFDGAGLLGREMAAVGASITANASDGIGTFDRLMFPLGPIPMRLVLTKNGSKYSAHPLIDLLSASGFIYGLVASKYSFDWNASLSGGVAVFREENPYMNEYGGFDVETTRRVNESDPSIRPEVGEHVGAITVGGTIFTSYLAPDDEILAHERVHALQFDFVTATLSDRADTWTMARTTSVDRWVKLNLVPMAFGAFNQAVVSLSNHDTVPWEREAILLSGHR